jgi:hypothetical protein
MTASDSTAPIMPRTVVPPWSAVMISSPSVVETWTIGIWINGASAAAVMPPETQSGWREVAAAAVVAMKMPTASVSPGHSTLSERGANTAANDGDLAASSAAFTGGGPQASGRPDAAIVNETNSVSTGSTVDRRSPKQSSRATQPHRQGLRSAPRARKFSSEARANSAAVADGVG